MTTTLKFDNLSKTSHNTTLLPPIDMELEAGECYVIRCNKVIGNKLLQIIAKQENPSTGSVLLFGENIEKLKSVHDQIGFLYLDDASYTRMRVKDYLVFFRKLYGSKVDLHDVMQQVGLRDVQNVRISKLTFSQERRLQIGRLILQDQPILIMEEPEQNVDLETSLIIHRIIEELKKKEKTILLTTIDLENALVLTKNVYSLTDKACKQIVVEEETDELPESEVDVQPVKLEKIPAKIDDKIILFNPFDINFIESSEGVAQLHLQDGIYPCTYTLQELESRLRAFGFFRCHRSYLVNLQQVKEVVTWTRNSYSLILDDQTRSSVPLSKNRFEELKGMLGL
ncbi:transcriptional regulator, LytTR family [Terribacillus aidingensis]|uniref:Transcriptional regulator, LytTR family n=1 Tax=Terribacillus aidingensis TaxID=586416 RepID=A0A285P7A3_9BACI|nr:LytTR family transcriptional regulator DNA-binding domain-containing protein [Terribacillus aidingensis]SNZ17073.1 transcriptional regulator, LytTR family [Terribacillus aidingensis]